jgi:nicotinate-nucleotide adenylyltransferase
MKKIGIFGGSFDPIHLGHLNLAIEMLEAHHLDEVWFCPAGRNPHKEDQHPVDASHRLKMIQLAIEKDPRFRICDLEIKRQGLSYTVDTLKKLHALQLEKGEQTSFYLIIGKDAARNFHRWHEPEVIIELARLLVGERRDETLLPSEEYQGSPAVVKAILEGLTSTRIMEISSTEIRERLLNKKYCYHLLPGKVLDYILTNHLY